MNRTLSRRCVLQGGGAAIGLPWLDAMIPRCARAASRPVRLVTYFTANGVPPETWYPTGTETSFELPACLAPLQRHRSRMIVFDGIANAGGLFYDCDASHEGGHIAALTGFPAAKQCSHIAEEAQGPSLDQAVADVIGTGSRFKSLQLGVAPGASLDTRAGAAAFRKGQLIFPEFSPVKAFRLLFDGPQAGNGKLPTQLLSAQRKSVLDKVMESYKRLQGKLGVEDKTRIDRHLTAIREIEKQILPSGTASCATPQLPGAIAETPETIPQRNKQQLELLALALACDQTRVASYMCLGEGSSDAVFTWLGHTSKHHELAHELDTARLTEINAWFADQLSFFLDRLASYPEPGGGTLLDNTLVLWWNELGMGDHRCDRFPFVLAGGAGGALKMGRFLKSPPRTSNNNLLLSIYNMTTGSQSRSFGMPELCTGPLAGL
ncbi:MAG: DUF1552 domain-containing protein [Deltaproteobacteria bacterium]|nr:DUF1552 domain-containing protein [Deltaproteobacteria bacterium]